MSKAEEPKIPVGMTIKAGQYLVEPALLTWTTQKPTVPGLYGYRKSRREGLYTGRGVKEWCAHSRQ